MGKDAKFSEYRGRVFGREQHVRFLMQRTKKPGLTVIVGRPKMGKTWFLRETCRRLAVQRDGLVGYEECLQTEPSLFLRASADLYSTWLSESRMIEQVGSLLIRHKEHLTTGIGQVVGRVFQGLVGVTAPRLAKIGELVRESFDALAKANMDLKTGGVALPPLD